MAKSNTVKVDDRFGNAVEVPVGIDGKTPVSPNNPPAKAVPEPEREAAADARKAEVKAAEAQAKASGAGKKAASTNKEDNNPAESQDPTPENKK